MKNEQEERKCWACHRTLVGNGRLGLCPICANRYGTPAAGLLVLGIGKCVKHLFKNSAKIVKQIKKT